MTTKLENGWPDVTYGDDPNELWEVKRGSDRLSSKQRQRFDWFKRVFGAIIKIAYFPKSGQITYHAFRNYQDFETWLKTQDVDLIFYTGRDTKSRFPECKAENKRGAVREILESEIAQQHPEIVNHIKPTDINTDPAQIRRGGPTEQIRRKKHGIYYTLLNAPGNEEARLANKLKIALAPFQTWGSVTTPHS